MKPDVTLDAGQTGCGELALLIFKMSGISHLAWVRLLERRIFSAKRLKAEIIPHSSTSCGQYSKCLFPRGGYDH
jgi:hypothetical protein